MGREDVFLLGGEWSLVVFWCLLGNMVLLKI